MWKTFVVLCTLSMCIVSEVKAQYTYSGNMPNLSFSLTPLYKSQPRNKQEELESRLSSGEIFDSCPFLKEHREVVWIGEACLYCGRRLLCNGDSY